MPMHTIALTRTRTRTLTLTLTLTLALNLNSRAEGEKGERHLEGDQTVSWTARFCRMSRGGREGSGKGGGRKRKRKRKRKRNGRRIERRREGGEEEEEGEGRRGVCLSGGKHSILYGCVLLLRARRVGLFESSVTVVLCKRIRAVKFIVSRLRAY